MKAPVDYIMRLFENPDEAYTRLLTELDWVQAGDTVPRREYYVHNEGLPYTYGSGKFAREYKSQPDHPIIAFIRERLREQLGVHFDVVFLNLYEHERHHLGWHADDSPEMSDDHPIVTVSLGAEREIWFRENGSLEVEKLLLHNGSAAVMLPGMQDTHQHRIPKHDRQCGPRISLTFRVYEPPEYEIVHKRFNRVYDVVSEVALGWPMEEARALEIAAEVAHALYLKDGVRDDDGILRRWITIMATDSDEMIIVQQVKRK